MAKQTFTSGQVLTAAQVNALQANDYNQTITTKTASYTPTTNTDIGTRLVMNSASATTITINTSIFSTGDTFFITNIGAGVCTITAGTATVSTSSSLALAQYGGGTLFFTSPSAAIFFSGGVPPVLEVDFLVVGGGAGGWPGSSGVYGSGGWGGRVVKSYLDSGTIRVSLVLGQNYIVTIGAGGASASEGNISYFNYINSSVRAQTNVGTPNISGTGASLTTQAGVSSSITGTSIGYGGGGGGANPAVAGVDGGGAGTGDGVAGTANRGGGGGGNGSGGATPAGAGGSGVVILRYLTTSGTITFGAGLTGTTATDGLYKVSTITAGTGNVSWA